MITVYLPGANSTKVGFAYMRDKLLTEDEDFFPSYDVENGLEKNVYSVRMQIEKISKGKPIRFVGHSMGGLIGRLMIEQGLNVHKFVSFSSPYGGLEMAGMLRFWLPSSQLMKDLNPKREFYSMIANKPLEIDHLIFVTVGGNNNLFYEPNDGVISVSSQRNIKAKSFIEVNLNHSEVLNCIDSIKKTKRFFEK